MEGINIYSDLHIHSCFSDGTNTVEEILKLSKLNKVQCISLVDHDTIEGVAALQEASKGYEIEVINGIEISTSINRTRIHILGYGIDINNSNLTNYSNKISLARTENTKSILENNIVRGSIDYNWNEVLKYFGEYAWINCNHVYEAMMLDGIYNDWSKYRDFYLANFGINSGVYEDIEGFTPKSAIDIILESKGIPVLAHPKLINDDSHILKLVEVGLKGIELYHPTQDVNDIMKYKEMANYFNLVVTGGTDWHGELGIYGASIGDCGINQNDYCKFKALLNK
ncbi:MAG: PHP domain-containing protein [Clostridium sp.]|uniref:PHP domain-containing protein n=1 Tax=Clostridium sp. TaxID=1506 RepID=UPI003D6D9545